MKKCTVVFEWRMVQNTRAHMQSNVKRCVKREDSKRTSSYVAWCTRSMSFSTNKCVCSHVALGMPNCTVTLPSAVLSSAESFPRRSMAGPNLEVFKFAVYVFFPVLVFLHYGDPEWYRTNVIPVRISIPLTSLASCDRRYSTKNEYSPPRRG